MRLWGDVHLPRCLEMFLVVRGVVLGLVLVVLVVVLPRYQG